MDHMESGGSTYVVSCRSDLLLRLWCGVRNPSSSFYVFNRNAFPTCGTPSNICMIFCLVGFQPGSYFTP
jgi:hypothetical protein